MLHCEELEQYNDMVALLTWLRTMLGTSSEGWVSHERYEAVKEASEQLKREIVMEQNHGDEELRGQ